MILQTNIDHLLKRQIQIVQIRELTSGSGDDLSGMKRANNPQTR